MTSRFLYIYNLRRIIKPRADHHRLITWFKTPQAKPAAGPRLAGREWLMQRNVLNRFIHFFLYFVSSPAECPRSGGRWQWKTRRPYQRAAAVRPLHPAGPASSRDSDPARAVMPQRWHRLTLSVWPARIAIHFPILTSELLYRFWF